MDLRRHLFASPSSGTATCAHVPETIAAPRSSTCQECGSARSLRLCAACGHVGCCESQKGDARAHALAVGHPVILSMPAGQGFTWCYDENRYVS
jgi:uncharacterized UBP type Zn finger protein